MLLQYQSTPPTEYKLIRFLVVKLCKPVIINIFIILKQRAISQLCCGLHLSHTPVA